MIWLQSVLEVRGGGGGTNKSLHSQHSSIKDKGRILPCQTVVCVPELCPSKKSYYVIV